MNNIWIKNFSERPIKRLLGLSWYILGVNKALTFNVIMTLILMMVIPIFFKNLGIDKPLELLYIIFSMNGKIYLGNILKEATSQNNFENSLKETTLFPFLLAYTLTSFGVIIGFMVMVVPLIITYVFMELWSGFAFFSILLFLYYYLLLQDKIISASTFMEGLKVGFSLFDSCFLKRVWNLDYFKFFLSFSSIIILLFSVMISLELITEKNDFLLVFTSSVDQIISFGIDVLLFPLGAIIAVDIIENKKKKI